MGDGSSLICYDNRKMFGEFKQRKIIAIVDVICSWFNYFIYLILKL